MMSCDPTVISGVGCVYVLSSAVSQEGTEEGLGGVWPDDTRLDEVVGARDGV